MSIESDLAAALRELMQAFRMEFEPADGFTADNEPAMVAALEALERYEKRAHV